MLVLNSSGPNGPMNQREDYHEAIKIKERFEEESGKGNARLHPSKDLLESIPKLDGDGIFLQLHQAHRRGGNHLKNGGRHQVGMNRDFSLFLCQGFSLTGNGDSFVSDGEYKHNTKPTHVSHSRTRVFLAWLKT